MGSAPSVSTWCWKKRSLRLSASAADFAARIDSKFGMRAILRALAENSQVCVNWLALHDVHYDEQDGDAAVDWDDPFKPRAVDCDAHNVWRECLALVVGSPRHFVEALDIEESRIGTTHCEDLQRFFRALIDKSNIHLHRLRVRNISRRGAGVFAQWMAQLMRCGNVMLGEGEAVFDGVGALEVRVWKDLFGGLIEAAVANLGDRVASQLAVEAVLRAQQRPFGVIQLVLSFCKHSAIRFHMTQEASARGDVHFKAKAAFVKRRVAQELGKALRAFEEAYAERRMAQYARKEAEQLAHYVPSFLAAKESVFAKYLRLICAGDVCLEFGCKAQTP